MTRDLPTAFALSTRRAVQVWVSCPFCEGRHLHYIPAQIRSAERAAPCTRFGSRQHYIVRIPKAAATAARWTAGY